MYIADLHVHTAVSDGSFTAEEVTACTGKRIDPYCIYRS